VDVEALTRSRLGQAALRVLAKGMESRFRYRFFGPGKILKGIIIPPHPIILEVGSGTGFYTLPLARMIDDGGQLVAMDILPESVELVAQKVAAAGLPNVQVIKGDAMSTGLDEGSFDVVVLFGVIPAPMIPPSRLFPEMHRVLKLDGVLAIWPPVPGFLPRAVLRTGLFEFAAKRNSVTNFRKH